VRCGIAHPQPTRFACCNRNWPKRSCGPPTPRSLAGPGSALDRPFKWFCFHTHHPSRPEQEESPLQLRYFDAFGYIGERPPPVVSSRGFWLPACTRPPKARISPYTRYRRCVWQLARAVDKVQSAWSNGYSLENAVFPSQLSAGQCGPWPGSAQAGRGRGPNDARCRYSARRATGLRPSQRCKRQDFISSDTPASTGFFDTGRMPSPRCSVLSFSPGETNRPTTILPPLVMEAERNSESSHLAVGATSVLHDASRRFATKIACTRDIIECRAYRRILIAKRLPNKNKEGTSIRLQELAISPMAEKIDPWPGLLPACIFPTRVPPARHGLSRLPSEGAGCKGILYAVGGRRPVPCTAIAAVFRRYRLSGSGRNSPCSAAGGVLAAAEPADRGVRTGRSVGVTPNWRFFAGCDDSFLLAYR